jgi:hypothetical protein
MARTRVEKGRLADVQPLVEEEASIAVAEDTRRAALASAQPVLNPPSCILGQIIGESRARGALSPSAARSTLTRDAQRKARREQQGRRGTGTAAFLAAIRLAPA